MRLVQLVEAVVMSAAMLPRALGAFALVASCATMPPAPATSGIEHVSGKLYDGVIFSAEYARSTYYHDTQRLWTPTRKDIARLERGLARWLRKEHLDADSVSPERARRHYIGTFDEAHGGRVVWVRFLGPPLYSETRLALPDGCSVPQDAFYAEGWFNPRTDMIEIGSSGATPTWSRSCFVPCGCVLPLHDAHERSPKMTPLSPAPR